MSDERKEFEAALERLLNAGFSDDRNSEPQARDAVLAIFDRIVGERDAARSEAAVFLETIGEINAERDALAAAPRIQEHLRLKCAQCGLDITGDDLTVWKRDRAGFEIDLMDAAKQLLDPVWPSSRKARDIADLFDRLRAERDAALRDLVERTQECQAFAEHWREDTMPHIEELAAERDAAVARAETAELAYKIADIPGILAERDAAVEQGETRSGIALHVITDLRAEVAALTADLEEIRESEAACCPEDVPFNEHIAALTAEREQNAAAVRELHHELGCKRGAETVGGWIGCIRDAFAELHERAEQALAERDEWIRRAENAAFPRPPLNAVELSILRERDTLTAENERLRAALHAAEPWAHSTPIPIGTGLGGGVASMTPHAATVASIAHWNECPGCRARAALAPRGGKP